MTDKVRLAVYGAAGSLLLLGLVFWSNSVALAQDGTATATPVVSATAEATANATADVTTDAPESGTPAAESAPVIDVWYGTEQEFGHLGAPQEWINILGNVSDPDGIKTLTYALNGDPEQTLSIGPNEKRLVNPGDFNIDIWRQQLTVGKNEILITATDMLDNQATQTVTVTYRNGILWQYPYAIIWNLVPGIQDAAQIVDGKWAAGPDGLRPLEIGYDRLVAIGDMVWTDYEVLVPITIHSVQEDNPNGQPPALGILMRWTGHIEDTASPGEQPRSGWDRDSAIAWWHWEKTTKLEFDHGEGLPFEPLLDVQYLFKVRVESTADKGALYKLKVWEAGEAEPTVWMLTHQAKESAPRNGSFLLLAHHVDATFGDLQVKGLAPLATPTPLPTDTPTITPTSPATVTPQATRTPRPTATTTPVAGAGRVTTAGPGSFSRTVEPSGSSFNSSVLYGVSFAVLVVLLIGLVLARRRLMS